jgi:hypothetical protein
VTRSSQKSNAGKLIFQDCKHIVLFYDSDEERDSQIISFINEGLMLGHLCVFGMMRLNDSSYFNSMTSKIIDFEGNLTKGNLIIMDLVPYFAAAIRKDMTLFNEARIEFERLVEIGLHKNKNKVRFAADATGSLFRDGYIEESLAIESWWQQIHLDGITTLCQFPKSKFSESNFAQYRETVALNHDIILDA